VQVCETNSFLLENCIFSL